MRARDVLLLSATALLAVAVGYVVLRPDPAATVVEPEAPTGTAPSATPDPVTPAQATVGTLPPSDPGSEPPRDPAAVASSGIVLGQVALDTRVIGRIDHYTVLVREALAPVPGHAPDRALFQVSRTFPLERSTPKFEIAEIPFSANSYQVTVMADGCNGTEQFVQVTKEKPVTARVQLALTAGVAFSVLVRDQMQNALTGLDVFLLPIGEPPGRRTMSKTSDGFGAAVFEDVLRGEYRVLVGSSLDPVNPPKTIDVMAAGAIQSVHVEVPRGQPMTLLITGSGFPLEGVEVVAIATDSVQYRQHKAASDATGRAVFKYLPAGAYQLNVSREGWERTARVVKIQEGVPVEPLEIQLARR